MQIKNIGPMLRELKHSENAMEYYFFKDGTALNKQGVLRELGNANEIRGLHHFLVNRLGSKFALIEREAKILAAYIDAECAPKNLILGKEFKILRTDDSTPS